MSHPLFHAMSSAKKFGGTFESYLPIHEWFDETKKHYPDMRHRAMRHHSEGIFWCEEKFGTYVVNSSGKMIPVRTIAEQHVMEDLGFIPTIKDYLDHMNKAAFIFKPGEARKIRREIDENKLDHVTPAS